MNTCPVITAQLGGMRGPLGIDLVGAPVPGEFLVKAPGAGRTFQTAAGTGADAGLRTDLAAVGGIERVNQTPTGIAGDGVTDDGPAVAARTSGITLPRQSYYFGTSQFVDVTMQCRPGCQLILADGVTLTPRAGFEGSAEQIFVPQGSGKVNLREAKLHHVPPDWWPVINGDATAAFAAAGAAHQLVRLFRNSYKLTERVPIGDHTCFDGDGEVWKNEYDGSRILFYNATDTIFLLGTETDPGSANAAPVAPQLKNMFITRQAPSYASNCTGVGIGYSLDALVQNVWSVDSINAFTERGATGAVIRDCRAKRDTPSVEHAQNAANDKFVAFNFPGDGFAGDAINSNPTSILDGNNYGDLTTSIANSTVIVLAQKRTDFFQMGKLESVGAFGVAASIIGDADGTTTGPPYNYTDNDVIFDHVTFDGIAGTGIVVSGIPPQGDIVFKSGYVAMAAGGGQAMTISTCKGMVDVAGLTLYAKNSAAGSTVSVANSNSGKLVMKVVEAAHNAVTLDTVTRFDIDLRVGNIANPLSGAAVQAIGACTYNTVKIGVSGAPVAARYNTAYQSTGAGNDHNSIDLVNCGSGIFGHQTEIEAGNETNSTFLNN